MSIDLDDVVLKKEKSIIVNGWRPIEIEYGLSQISNQVYLIWKVKEVNHTFNIPLSIVMEHHKGDYTKHFQATLVKFREDLLEWIKQDLPEDWMKNYYKEYYGLLDI